MNKQLRKYYRAVRRNLPCSGQQKKRILAEIDGSIHGFVEENPTAGYAEIVKRYGTPQQITSAYLDEMDHRLLAKELKLKDRIVKIVATALIAALVMFGITLGIVIRDDYNSEHGYLTIVDGVATIIEEG